MPVGSSRLEASIAPCPGFMDGSKEAEGIHYHVVPQVLRSLVSLSYAFCLSESFYSYSFVISEFFKL